ncbi:MAG: M23 family metallopeptidase [Candidatus Liptonbacteria bacterium]|nr:M23 family metallopeptidase [Candidatus Liptonbacteria bacterium]
MGSRAGSIQFFLIVFGAIFVFISLGWIRASLFDGHFLPTSVIARSSGSGLAAIDFNFFTQEKKKSYISQGYGITGFSNRYPGRRHNGIDIAAKKGAPVYSAAPGTVIASRDQDIFCRRRGYGKFVAIKNANDGRVLLYAHLNDMKVKAGEEIARGSLVGHVGMTGLATAPHLHFSVFMKNSFSMDEKDGCGLTPVGDDVNPIPYLEKLSLRFRV